MLTMTTIGLDIAKTSFAAHCAGASGKEVKKAELKRAQVLPFFAGIAPRTTSPQLNCCLCGPHPRMVRARLRWPRGCVAQGGHAFYSGFQLCASRRLGWAGMTGEK